MIWPDTVISRVTSAWFVTVKKETKPVTLLESHASQSSKSVFSKSYGEFDTNCTIHQN